MNGNEIALFGHMKKHSGYNYSGGKRNPDLTIKITENVHLTHRHD